MCLEMVKPEYTNMRPTGYSYYHRQNGLKCYFGDFDGMFYTWAHYDDTEHLVIKAIAEVKEGDIWPDAMQTQFLDALSWQTDFQIFLIQHYPKEHRFIVYQWKTNNSWEHTSDNEHTQWIKDVILKS
jgi:hypothetical protein